MFTSINAGSVTIALTTATSMTALAGTRCPVNADQRPDPGTAPLRLKANSIRDADVMHEVEQKNCADAEMNSTSAPHLLPIDCVKMYATPPAPTPALSGWPWALSGIANTTQSSRMWPPSTEQTIDRQIPLAAAGRGAGVSSGR